MSKKTRAKQNNSPWKDPKVVAQYLGVILPFVSTLLTHWL